MNLNKNIALGAGIFIIVAATGYYFWNGPTTAEPDVQDNQNLAIDLTQGATTTDAYKLELISITEPPPSLNRPIPASTPGLDEHARAALLIQMASTTAALKKNPDSYIQWLLLGVQRKILGDYEGAEQVWVYATKRAPDAYQAFSNLANLYATVYKNYAKAEANYKKAIALAPTDSGLYINLYELYKYWYKQNTSLAEDTLKQGIAQNLRGFDLHVLLARYYREKGRTAEANAQYDIAIGKAETSGNTGAAASLREERAQ